MQNAAEKQGFYKTVLTLTLLLGVLFVLWICYTLAQKNDDVPQVAHVVFFASENKTSEILPEETDAEPDIANNIFVVTEEKTLSQATPKTAEKIIAEVEAPAEEIIESETVPDVEKEKTEILFYPSVIDLAQSEEAKTDLKQSDVATNVPAPVVQNLQEASYEEKTESVAQKDDLTPKEETPAKNSAKAYIAIVIDDMGISDKRTREILELNQPLTAAFLTYGKNLQTLLAEAQKSGCEVILHTPMEPKVDANLAPDTLMVAMTDEKVEKGFEDMLQKFETIKIKGINNHMGSRFTENPEKLKVIMRLLRKKGLYFLDSKTTPLSKAETVALNEGVPYVARNIFLDNENKYEYILKQLEKTEKTALKNGYAIAIGHPKTETIKALRDWAQTLQSKDIELAYLSEVVAIKEKNE